jgi:hypothetical protein
MQGEDEDVQNRLRMIEEKIRNNEYVLEDKEVKAKGSNADLFFATEVDTGE